jgi:single-strand DNA-binding protein
MSYASITVLGHVGKDPEIKRLDNGATTARFSLAVNRQWKDAKGNTVKKVTWYDVVSYQPGERGLVTGVIQPYVTKGSKLLVQGEPTIEEWTDKEDNKRKSFRIKLGPGSHLSLEGDTNGGSKREPGDEAAPATNGSAAGTPPTDGDNIPF